MKRKTSYIFYFTRTNTINILARAKGASKWERRKNTVEIYNLQIFVCTLHINTPLEWRDHIHTSFEESYTYSIGMEYVCDSSRYCCGSGKG